MMDLGNAHPLDFQFKEVERNINEHEQEISRLVKEHNIPAEWFDREFNAETHDFETDAVKQAYLKIARNQHEMKQHIQTFCISRDKLQEITKQIDSSVINNAQDAKMAIVKANFWLVVSIVKRFKEEVQGREFFDLIQEGNIGLMKAIDNYDYQGGFQFNTYVTWWVRQSISRAIASAEGNDDPNT
ncbi:MAG: sigma-70 family RNA polymerase sigma factor [Candidatus Poribacteria bacterium]|nr:sigma-70 family RNA polymerase sigma factor [Candidatus Poribacteria bacterium]